MATESDAPGTISRTTDSNGKWTSSFAVRAGEFAGDYASAFEMRTRFLLPFVLVMWCAGSLSQPVELPLLSIDATRPNCSVTYDATRRVYRYVYSIELSVEGTTSSGRTARDTDTLTFFVE